MTDTFEVRAGALGAEADHDISTLEVLNGELQNKIADDELTITTQAAELERQAIIIRRLRRKIRLLTGGPTPTTLFSAKPDPNTEANYDASEVDAGVPYPVHNHYATTWSQAVTMVNQCSADVCRITVATTAKDNGAIAQFSDDLVIVLGVIHEADAAVANNRVTIPNWKAAQTSAKQSVDVVNPTRTHKIEFGVCLTGFCMNGGGGRNPDDYFMPGVHEYLASDFYPELMVGPGPVEYSVTPERAMGATVRYCAAKGVKSGIFEWGLHADDVQPGDRARYIRAINAYARENKFSWVLYWDHGSCYLRNDDEFAAAGGA